MGKRISPYIQRRHLELYGRQDDEILIDDDIPITSSSSVLSSPIQDDN